MKITPVILADECEIISAPTSNENLVGNTCSTGDKYSGLESIVLLVQDNARFNDPIIVVSNQYADLVEQQLSALECKVSAIVCEPVGRGTAAAVFIASEVADGVTNPLLLVLPSNLRVNDTNAFLTAVDKAAVSVRQDRVIVAFDLTEIQSETSVDYQNAAAASSNSHCSKFGHVCEKPKNDIAKNRINNPDECGDSSVLLFDRDTMCLELREYAPNVLAPAIKSVALGSWLGDHFTPSKAEFLKLPSISLDYAIIERSCRIVTVAVYPNLPDLRSENAVNKISHKDKNSNVLCIIGRRDVDNYSTKDLFTQLGWATF